MLTGLKKISLIVFIPILYGFNLVLIYYDFQKSLFSIQSSYLLLIIFSLLLSVIGLILWFSSYFYLRTNFSVLPRAKKLVTAGPYRFFSHPIYLGVVLTMAGLSLATSSLKGLFYTLFVSIPLSVLRARKEEKLLKKKFGKKYEAYRKSTLF